MPKVLKVRDKAESYRTPKKHLFDIPFCLLLVGKSYNSGKTNLATNLVLRDEFYREDFHGDNIYIVSGSLSNDNKLKAIVREKEIPDSNLMSEFDEERLQMLYDIWEEAYEEAVSKKRKPDKVLLFLDDMSFGGNLKKSRNGILSRIAQNGRHILCSMLITTQKYSDILPAVRANSTGCIFFATSPRELELINDEHNYHMPRRDFRELFQSATEKPHSFMAVNYSNPATSRYLDKEFAPLPHRRK